MATSRSLTVQAPTRQGYAPLFDQYNRWASMYGSSLPRSFDTFRSGDFSPFEPILPNPIDIPEQPSGRPRPRRWQFPVGWNLPVGQPGTEGIKMANFQVLRDLADVGSIPRRAVEICKSDLLNLAWDIVPTESAEKAMQGNPAKRADFESRKAELWQWLMYEIDPGLYPTFHTWLNAAMEDLLVLDALAIHILPSKGKRGGPLNSNVGGLELIDGSSVRPLLNTYGGRPRPPEPAFQQLIWGVPRVDLMDIINLGPDATIEDLKELNPVIEQLTETVDEWSGDQLVYIMANPRTNTPYGFGPVEQCLLPISIMQARQTWQWEFFRSGSLPQVFLDPGTAIGTPEEARELQEAINMTGGDLASRHQVLVLPPGAKPMPMKDSVLTDEFDTLMVSEIAMSFGLSIGDFGMMPKVGAMTSPAAAKADQQSAQDAAVRRSTIPRARIVERLFTRLIQVHFGCSDMRFSAGVTEQGESQNDLDTRWINRTKSSLASIDEARLALDLDPYGEPWSTVPLAFTAKGVSPLPTSVESANLGLESLKNPPTTPAPVVAAKPSNDDADTPTMSHQEAPATAAHAGARSAETATRTATKRRASSVRDVTLQPLRDTVKREITRLANEVRDKKLTTAQFTDQSRELMTSSTVQAARHGANQAASEFSVPVAPQTDAMAIERATSQHPYLVGMALGALGGSAMTLANRAALYGASLTAAYEQGYGTTALSALAIPSAATDGLTDGSGMSPGSSNAVITWHVNSSDPCDQCDARDGETYTTQTLPGWPGDGSFGGAICLGGPNCRCTLTYDDGTNTATGTNTLRAQSLAGNLAADMGPMGHVDQWIAGRQAFTDALPDIVQPNELYSAQARAVMRDSIRTQISQEMRVNPADVPASLVSDRVPAIYKSLTGDIKTVYELLTKHYPDKSIEWIGQMAWSRRTVPLDEISVTGPASNKDAKTIRRMSRKMRKGKKIKPLVLIDPGEDGLLQVADGHHRAAAALHANKQKVPAYVGRPQTDDDWRREVMEMQIVRAKKMHGTPGGTLTDVDPSDTLNGWPLFETSGTGPTSMPYEPGGGLILAEGSDSTDRDSSFVGKMVEDPSDDPVRHEFGGATMLNLNKNFGLSSGFVPFDLSGPETDVKYAGLLVMALDSGRVLMLQRSLNEDDDAAGTWEFPGGNLEDGETALDGAIREWQEEVGSPLPSVKIVGRWQHNAYMGFFAVCQRETDISIKARDVVNPDDPDGDNLEAVAWFWPTDLTSMPGVRRETRDHTPWSRIISEATIP